MFTGDTSPAGQRIGPPQPTPAATTGSPTDRARRAAATRSADHSVSASAPCGVGRTRGPSTTPDGSTTAAASLVPPTSTASTGPDSATSGT